MSLIILTMNLTAISGIQSKHNFSLMMLWYLMAKFCCNYCLLNLDNTTVRITVHRNCRPSGQFLLQLLFKPHFVFPHPGVRLYSAYVTWRYQNDRSWKIPGLALYYVLHYSATHLNDVTVIEYIAISCLIFDGYEKLGVRYSKVQWICRKKKIQVWWNWKFFFFS